MGKRGIQEVCGKCGALARRIYYTSRSKGRTYHYYKYVHSNGVVHYSPRSHEAPSSNSVVEHGSSILEVLEEIVAVNMRGKELRFGDIKSLLEELYGRSVGTATIYRNINKLLKLELIAKRNNDGVVLYTRRLEESPTQEMKMTRMTIGLNFTQDRADVTLFAHIKNLGLRLITGIPISIPVGAIDSLDDISLTAFDETKRITISKENIAYSYPGRTGISITLNKTLRKSEEEDFFMSYSSRLEEYQIKFSLLSDVDLLRVNCEVPRGIEVEIKKILVDGLKEIGPFIVRRTGVQIGHSIVEAEFENASRGDTIIVSLGK